MGTGFKEREQNTLCNLQACKTADSTAVFGKLTEIKHVGKTPFKICQINENVGIRDRICHRMI